ncbi:MAG: helix-hairpin-helix domain-containing protein [Candidatus Scalindua sp.]|nr:helix-hairpin-helix domain-containing protein [Candidatus Scalindua sp.]
MDVRIEVDYREKPSGILEVLYNRNDVIVEEKKLSFGDYLINGHIVVERKTTKDFIISIIDGRLFTQASKLKKFAEKPIIVIEGRDLYRTGYAMDPQAIKGAITSLSTVWYIPVILSRDVNGTADFLTMAGIQDIEYQSLYVKRLGRKPKRLKRLKLHILQGLPQIGPKTANRMLEHFGSIEKAITADESELAGVGGIGRKKASLIRKIVGIGENYGE